MWPAVVDTSLEINMADVCEREKIAKEIEKISKSIHKKHRALKRERKEEEEENSLTFEPSALHKFDDRSHDRVQPITSAYEDHTTDRVVRKRFRNDRRFVSDDDSKSVANVGRPRALRAGLGLLDQKYVEAILRGARGKESGIDDIYDVHLHKNGLMFVNKSFDVDEMDNIIIDEIYDTLVYIISRN
ncbi:hypothetical protein G5I_02593 [Acromyrmex echinatior]|uniref:Uncharacterized protein n=1 Tax=Acromyrmex echinatior TaxID=103372 RepID=F4WAQ4_ACREC|nr:hypothetical protein G5I_02593 [Acromyrmex echinatior]